MGKKQTVSVIRWVARMLGLCLFAFWGAFFVEHLEWFFARADRMPPVRAWIGQVLHLAMLLGFLMAWKWEALGSGIIIGGALSFFLLVAGKNFYLFFFVTIVPAILFLYCRYSS